MTFRKVALAAWLIAAAGAGQARAQIPGLGGGGASSLFAPSAAAGSAIPSAATAALPSVASAQPTLGGFFGLTKPNLAACKAKFCASPLGSLSNNALGPYSTLTGGLIPTCCPTVPSDAAIAALAAAGGPNGAEAVAAKIKKDEADAKARRAAIRYLATVDCHYWPEAELAIISGLRDDRNECVRYEAALALLNGCCCNARTIEALNIVVSGSKKDGKPEETSERVKCAALAALSGVPAPRPSPRARPSRASRPPRTRRDHHLDCDPRPRFPPSLVLLQDAGEPAQCPGRRRRPQDGRPDGLEDPSPGSAGHARRAERRQRDGQGPETEADLAPRRSGSPTRRRRRQRPPTRRARRRDLFAGEPERREGLGAPFERPEGPVRHLPSRGRPRLRQLTWPSAGPLALGVTISSRWTMIKGDGWPVAKRQRAPGAERDFRGTLSLCRRPPGSRGLRPT